MDTSQWTQGLLYGAVGVGTLAALYALLLTYAAAAAEPVSQTSAQRREQLRALCLPLRRWAGFLLGLALLLGLGVFLLSLLKISPFQAGGALGFGFLIGAAATLLAALFIGGSQTVGTLLLSEDPDRPRGLLRLQPGAVVTALLGWGGVTVALTGWLIKSDPLTAYLGLGCGAWFVAWIVGSPLTMLRPPEESADSTPALPTQRVPDGEGDGFPPLTGGLRGGPSGGGSLPGQAAGLQANLLLLFASSLSLLALGVGLGAFHEGEAAVDLRLFPLAAGAGLVLMLAVAGPLAAGGKASRILSVILLFGGTGAVAWLAWRRFTEEPALPYPFLCGLLSGAFLLGLAALLRRKAEEPDGGTFLPTALQEGFVLAFLLLSTVVVAFLIQRGFGVILAALGMLAGVGWSATGAALRLKQSWARALRGADDQTAAPAGQGPGVSLGLRFLHAAVVFLFLVALFRLFYERTPLGSGRADLYFHYTFIGLLLGLAGPFALSGLYADAHARLRRWREVEGGAVGELPIPVDVWLDWLLTGGLVMAAGPALVAFLWGARGAAGLLTGLVADALLLCLLAPVLLPHRIKPDLSVLLDSALFTLPLLGLATLQLTRLLEPLTDAKREVKLIVLGAALGVAVVWGVVRQIRRKK